MTDRVVQQPLEEASRLEEEDAASTTNRTEARTEHLSALEDDEEAERQDNLHLTHVTRAGEITEAAKAYLTSREGEAASGIDFVDNVPVAPTVPPSEIQRREQARLEELTIAQRRCDEARERANHVREECHSAQAALRQLTGRPTDPDQFSSVSQQVANADPLVNEWLAQQRRINNKQETPDDWIDQYSAGLLPPVSNNLSARSAVSAELASYQGKSLEWFELIDLFRALVHDTPKSPGEKLALLKLYLENECLDVVYGLGGGETAYIQALVRLKETYGRRDVMRAAHLQALDRLELKGEAGAFKRFAERVRSHLFDLSRIGEMSTADVIEKICLKLNLQDRLAWNEERHGRLERRSLNDFGTWLCSRASAYQNAYSIAASQANFSAPMNKGFNPRRTRIHQASSKTHEGGIGMQSNKPYCFKCEKGHRLSDSEDFKALPIGEKIQFCMRRRLCFNCFSCKHSVRECPTSRPCKHTDCRYTHHPLLHDSEKLPVKTVHPSTARAEKEHRVALGMLRLQVQGSDGGWCWANIFTDEGSDTTLVRSAFATSLKIRGSPQVLTVDGAGGVVTRYPSELIHFQLRAESGEIITLEGSTMRKVASPAPTTDWSKEKMRWPHLRDLPVGEVRGKVDILIGTDHLHLLAARESREGEDYEPIASRTRLGWIIRGVTNGEAHALAVRSFIIAGRTQLDRLTSEMRRFCDTEAFGTEFKQGCLSPDNQRAMALVKGKTRKLAVGYEVPIIWREGEPDLPNNRAMAVNRFQSLLRRFQHQPELERDYEAAMQKTLDQGDEAESCVRCCRPFRGKALNDAIIGGPALQPALAAVITRFRQEECAWASDIEAMFSRLRLSAEDARFFCFLWRQKSSGNMVTYKMDRLPFGASYSPFVAIHTIQRIAEDAGVEEKMAVAVRERMYVDDYLSSAPTVQEAVQEASAVRKMLADADLNLQRWVSNSPDFLQQMTVSTGLSSSNIHQLGSNCEEKVLGVFWDVHSDTLGFKVAEAPDVKFTKMELASRVAGVFDPLGTASPIIVKAKIRLRMLGQSGQQWT
ncbi:uncharacterized protein LOC130703066 [Daphnia carinata]|uniref:uncharacterized protein LOC130703066 n=1 Tax=Daphnia carinata TaxID=120202 RepID=UPI00257DAD6E|nr:uncharacterized protein LOC130703066 [Daphnia carinata]